MPPQMQLSDPSTIQLFSETEGPLFAFLSKGICRRSLSEILCIRLAIVALQWPQCIQWMQRCSAGVGKLDQKV